jgi:hypothetical protein
MSMLDTLGEYMDHPRGITLNEELTKESPFKNALKKLLGKALQLAISLKLIAGIGSGVTSSPRARASW